MLGWWDVANVISKRDMFAPSPSLCFPPMCSFLALGFCGLSLTLAGVAATLTDQNETLAVDAMAAGLVITASAALPSVLAPRR